MKKQKLKELLEQTKVEIADELDSFIAYISHLKLDNYSLEY